MRVVIEQGRGQGRQVHDVHEKNLGYDITSLDLSTGELRLIEVDARAPLALDGGKSRPQYAGLVSRRA